MLNIEYIKNKHSQMIRDTYFDCFQRHIRDDEVEIVLSSLIPVMEKELKELKGFSESEYVRYMAKSGSNLTFSPEVILIELNRVLATEGLEVFSKADKYKKLREMEMAVRYCLANYKRTGRKLMIRAQDSPDIILVPTGDTGKEIKGFMLEVMAIPQITKDTLIGDLPVLIAGFIANRKFSKSYGGHCALIVGLDFVHTALDFKVIATELSTIKPNPYDTILITCISSEDGRTVSVFQVYPQFSIVSGGHNLHEEPGLLY